MKINFLVNSLHKGGAELALASIASDLSSRHDVVIFYIDEEAEPISTKGVKSKRLGIFSGKGFYVRVGNYIVALLRLAIMKKRSPAELYCSFLLYSNLVNFFSSLLSAHNFFVFSERTFVLDRMNKVSGWFVKKLIKVVYSRAKKVVCVSSGIKDYLLKVGVPSERLVVVPNPLINAPTCPARFSEESLFSIFYIGRLHKVKNLTLLVEAFSHLSPETYPYLTIIGDGEEKKNILNFAKEKGVADRVRFCGFCEEPFEKVGSNPIFVLPSFSESFGNVVVEALSFGSPVLISKTAKGAVEVSGDFFDDLKFDPYNVASIISSIKKVSRSSEYKSYAKKVKFRYAQLLDKLPHEEYEKVFYQSAKGDF